MAGGQNKHENVMIRKKFKKSLNYKCCGKPTGNKNKESRHYNCTYPMVYKKYDCKIWNKQMCRNNYISYLNLEF